MNSANKYSIYKSSRARIGLHLLFWLLYYIGFLCYLWSVFGTNIFSEDDILITLFVLEVAILFYFYDFVIYPLLSTRKVFLILVYVFLLPVIYFGYELLLISIAYKYFPYTKLFSKKLKLDLLSIQIWKILLKALVTGLIWDLLFVIVVKCINDIYINYKEKQQAILLRNNTEINFLRAQIQPHFLFNALNNIYGLAIDNDKASRMILQFSHVLRYNLYHHNTNDVTLKDEINYLEEYIHLERARHNPDNFRIAYDFSNIENNQVRIKPMILSMILRHLFLFTHTQKNEIIINVSEKNATVEMNIRYNEYPDNESITLNEANDWDNVQQILSVEYATAYTLTKEKNNIHLVLQLQNEAV